jgi:maleylacetate reductase
VASGPDFTWVDGERLIRFGPDALGDAARLLGERGFDDFALLTTGRAANAAPELAEGASVVAQVPSGPVPEAAAAVREQVRGRPLVALGGGRVIDSAKAIAGADGVEVAALPTTLSGAELTGFHRLPAGVEQGRLVRPSLVIADPDLMASQPMPQLAASAMNSLAHAIEATYTPLANPVAEMAGLRAAALIAEGLGRADPDRNSLALGGLLAAWASGSAGYAFIHVVCQTIVRVAGTPHAQTYAVVLPHGLRLLEPRVPELLTRFAAALGAGDPIPELAAARAAHLGAQAHVTRLAALGMREEHVPAVVEQALARAQLGNTPEPPDAEELTEMVGAALGA